MRKKIIAGNWKMNMTITEAKALCDTLIPISNTDQVDVVFCVPSIDISTVVEKVKGTSISVGAENLYFEDKGAYRLFVVERVLNRERWESISSGLRCRLRRHSKGFPRKMRLSA